MKPLMVPLMALVLGAALLGGCSAARKAPPVQTAAVSAPAATIPFRTGVSWATVEKVARQQACGGGQGAGLITAPGPVEVYRMQCENGKVFMARCELRQCKPM
jgi:ABC-type sugar transport system substrate-binding protein